MERTGRFLSTISVCVQFLDGDLMVRDTTGREKDAGWPNSTMDTPGTQCLSVDAA